MIPLSAGDRVEALAAYGIVLYLDDRGQLRAGGSELLIDSARPMIRQQSTAIVAYLQSVLTSVSATDQESALRAEPRSRQRLGSGMCPDCARR